MSFISYDTILDTFCDFDKDIIIKSGLDFKEIRNKLRLELEKEDLYILSFLGNKINDNDMFRLLSGFSPRY